jgi:hypothetical protein
MEQSSPDRELARRGHVEGLWKGFTAGCYIALTMELRKSSPAAGEFLFEIDSEPLEEQVTALGGIPLLVRAARSLDVPGSVARHLRLKQRERGFDEATYVESFLVLNAAARRRGSSRDAGSCSAERGGSAEISVSIS